MDLKELITKFIQLLNWKIDRKLFDRLITQFYFAYSTFIIWDEFQKALASNHVGKKLAKENCNILKKYDQFFNIKKAGRDYALINLAKFFDKKSKKEGQPLTLKYLAKRFLEREDKLQIKNWEKKNEEALIRLIKLRNRVLAHNDIEIPDETISIDEIYKIFEFVEKYLNSLSKSSRLNSGIWLFSHVKDNAINDTQNLINDLKKYEVYRLKEIKRKYERIKRENAKRFKDMVTPEGASTFVPADDLP